MNTPFVVAAGIPPDLGDLFEAALGKALEGWTILARLDLAPAAPYTPEYAASLYERTANKLLRRTGNRRREDLLAGVHLVLLYVARESKSTLVDAFKLEALTVPLIGQDALHEDRLTPNARQRVAKNLASEAVKALKGAKRLLAVIEEEVSQRDNKTCLLLPPKNLGKPSAAVIHCVQEAASIGRDGSDFKKGAALLGRRPNQSLRQRGRRQLDPSRRGEGAAEGTGGRWYLCRQRRLGVFRWYSRAWWRVSVRINAPAARGGLRTVATAAKCHRAPVDYHPVAGQMPRGLQ